MNDTTNKDENQTPTNYQILLKNLDDWNFSRKFYGEQLERGKEIISGILSVTSGGMVVTGDNAEWGHGDLLELLAMFQIRHKNFGRSTLAENLQWIFSRGQRFITKPTESGKSSISRKEV